MPLALGNVWEYAMIVVTDGDSTISDTTRMEILGSVILADDLYFTTNSDLIFANTVDGLSVARYDHAGGFEEFEILLRYPIEAGIEYSYTSSKINSMPLRIEVRADTVHTFLGSLMAVIYTVKKVSGNRVLEFGFTPGIGMVSLKNSLGTLWLLLDYKLRE